MGYKDFSDSYSFADLAVGKSLENSRSLKRMEQINKVVNWQNVEAFLPAAGRVDGILRCGEEQRRG